MFYLDYVLYATILIQLLILLYYIYHVEEGFQNTKYKKNKNNNGNKKGDRRNKFQHKGNSFIARGPEKPDFFYNFHVMEILQAVYSLLNIFAVVFVQFPNKYIGNMRVLMQKQGLIMYGYYKSLIQKSNEIFQTYMKKFNILGSIKVIFTKPTLNFYKGK